MVGRIDKQSVKRDDDGYLFICLEIVIQSATRGIKVAHDIVSSKSNKDDGKLYEMKQT